MKTRFQLTGALVSFFIASAWCHGGAFIDEASPFAETFSAYISDREAETSFRSLLIPSGGRSESMGTAFSAVSDDISFFDYNPAASAVLSQTEVAVFHNAWISDSALETVAAATRFGNFGTGIQLKCFYVPFTEYSNFGERVASSYYSETYATLNAAYTFLAGYPFRGISVGINVKTAWRSMPDYGDRETGIVQEDSGLAQSAIAIMGDAGLLIRFNIAKAFASKEPNCTLALAANNIGVSFTGFGESITADDPLPSTVRAGFAFRPFPPLLISAEYCQYFTLSDMQEFENRSIGSGFETTLTPFFTFSGGFLLKGGSPRISMGSGFLVSGICFHINYTFDITSSLNPVNHISLSAKMQLGDKGRAEAQRKADEHYINGLMLYAEGTRESIEGAINEWTEVLRINKRYTPAKEALKTATDMLNAHDAITSIGRLQTK